jgi:hypothetical protein
MYHDRILLGQYAIETLQEMYWTLEEYGYGNADSVVTTLLEFFKAYPHLKPEEEVTPWFMEDEEET